MKQRSILIFLLIILFLGALAIIGFTFRRQQQPISTALPEVFFSAVPTVTEKEFKKGGEENMDKKILMIVAPEGFRDEEYQKPREILEEAGVIIETASKGVKEAKGALGTKVKVDKDLNEVVIDDYQGIIFVGGPGTTVYFNDKKALGLAKEAVNKGKIIGAICIAPSILANAGILSGIKATSFPSEKDNLLAKGAIFLEEEVVVDGGIITASGPQAASKFGEEIKRSLGL